MKPRPACSSNPGEIAQELPDIVAVCVNRIGKGHCIAHGALNSILANMMAARDRAFWLCCFGQQ
jgi:hypothetical protein